MTNRLLIRTETQQSTARQQRAADPGRRNHWAARRRGSAPSGRAHPDRYQLVLRGERRLLRAAEQHARQPPAKSIPSDFLFWYKKVGQQYGVPWTILAGIGTVESNNGQTTLPGVRRGQNGFGAAGPMQIGIEGASGNTWGGAPVHPARQVVAGVATDENGNGTANVYDPPVAIAGRPGTCSSSACSRSRRRPSSPTTTCSPTCRAC